MSWLNDMAPRAPRAKLRLKRSIGMWMTTALVVGNMVTPPAVLGLFCAARSDDRSGGRDP